MSNSSKWWRDIINIEGSGGVGWFNEEVVRRVMNGEDTKFWYGRWRGELPLRDKFPRLFAMSNQKEATVAEIWVSNGVEREWRFSWRRRFFVWEEELLNNLLAVLEGHVWVDEHDHWVWKLKEERVFTVWSMYKKLETMLILENNWGREELRVFNHL